MSDEKKYFKQDMGEPMSALSLKQFTEEQKGKPRHKIIGFAHETTVRIVELVDKVELWRFRTGVYRKQLRAAMWPEAEAHHFSYRESMGNDEMILSATLHAIEQAGRVSGLEMSRARLQEDNTALRSALAEMERHLLESNRAMRGVAPLLAGGASVVSDATVVTMAGTKAGGFRGHHNEEEHNPNGYKP